MKDQAQIFSETRSFLEERGLSIVQSDTNKPWGGFFVLDENDAGNFIRHFFPDVNKEELLSGKLSPKILMVAPYKKLSWQYHNRRSEIWALIRGEASVITSDSDIEDNIEIMKESSVVTLRRGKRHRLVGMNDWGIVAEIWIHTDQNNPSNEDDIVRLQDDFGR